MPSSSKFSVAAGGAAPDYDRGIPAIDPTVVLVVAAAVVFPNKLLINPARYAK
jgi:hypothetical protein